MTGKRGPYKKKPILDRMFAKRKVDERSGCWLWQGALRSSGYGVIGVAPKRLVAVHRLSYELLVGPIPDGLVIDHLCRVTNCFNPEHLEPVTQRENLLRGLTIVAANRSKTACPKGHPYDEENTAVSVVSKRGGLGRNCRTCHRERERERSRAKRAQLRKTEHAA